MLYIEPYVSYGHERSYDVGVFDLDVGDFPVLYIEPYVSYDLERSYDVGVFDLDVGEFPVLYIEPYVSYGLDRSYDVGVFDLDVRESLVLYIEPYVSYGLERSYDVGVFDLDVGEVSLSVFPVHGDLILPPRFLFLSCFLYKQRTSISVPKVCFYFEAVYFKYDLDLKCDLDLHWVVSYCCKLSLWVLRMTDKKETITNLVTFDYCQIDISQVEMTKLRKVHIFPRGTMRSEHFTIIRISF